MAEGDPCYLTIKSRVSIIVSTTDDQFEVGCCRVCDIVLNSDWVLGIVLDKTNSSVQRLAVTVVEEGPNSFDVVKVDILDHICLTFRGVTSGEMVIGGTLPNSEHSVTHFDIVVGIILCESREEVPGSILSIRQSRRVVCEEASPESVSVLLKVFKIRDFFFVSRGFVVKSNFDWNLLCRIFFITNDMNVNAFFFASLGDL